MITAKTERKNPQFFEKLQLRLKKAGTKEVAVGFPRGTDTANAHYDNGASIVDVATWNNFGTDRTPRRPFMDNAAPDLQKDWKTLCAKAAKRLNAGELNEDTILKAGGLQAEATVRKHIDAITSPPNSPETIQRKKSAKPLIDSGDMRKYVTSIVRPKT